jgi:hypothetical protein
MQMDLTPELSSVLNTIACIKLASYIRGRGLQRYGRIFYWNGGPSL